MLSYTNLFTDCFGRVIGFPGEQVTLLASDQPVERQPTRGNILRRLSNMAAVIPPDGLLLISFAGHGIERGAQAFLLPSDSQVSNDVDLAREKLSTSYGYRAPAERTLTLSAGGLSPGVFVSGSLVRTAACSMMALTSPPIRIVTPVK